MFEDFCDNFLFLKGATGEISSAECCCAYEAFCFIMLVTALTSTELLLEGLSSKLSRILDIESMNEALVFL